MAQIKIKRVYDDPEKSDGYRVLVDRLWPRGMKKENLKYDLWAKEITPSPDLRKWFHEDIENHWDKFASSYKLELSKSDAVKDFISEIKDKPVVTLLYAAKDTEHTHAEILKDYLDHAMKK